MYYFIRCLTGNYNDCNILPTWFNIPEDHVSGVVLNTNKDGFFSFD